MIVEVQPLLDSGLPIVDSFGKYPRLLKFGHNVAI